MHTIDPLRLFDPNVDNTHDVLLRPSPMPSMSSSTPTMTPDATTSASSTQPLPQSQTLYMPIAGPPTPAPSPSPNDHRRNTNLVPHPFTMLSPHANPMLRRQYLTAILQACTPAELLFVSMTIAPLLKRDFLVSLPVELALHVLSFIDDPRTLARASQVSKTWRRLVTDEWVWKQMCITSGYDDWDDQELPRSIGEDLISTNTSISLPSPTPCYPTGCSDLTTLNTISLSLVGPSTLNQGGQFNTSPPKNILHFTDPSTSRLTNEANPTNNGNGHEPLAELEKFAHCPMDPALEWLATRTRSQQSSGPSSPASSSFPSTSGAVSPTTDAFQAEPASLHRGNSVQRHGDPEQNSFSFQQHFKESYITMQNWRHGGHLLRRHQLPVTEPDSGVITSLSIDSDWVVAGLANSKIHVFSAKTGVLARTLVGHDLGVWGVCLVSKGGFWAGGPSVSPYEKDDDDERPGQEAREDGVDGRHQGGWEHARRGNQSTASAPSSSSRRHREGRSSRHNTQGGGNDRRGHGHNPGGVANGLGAAASSSSGGINNGRALDRYLPPSLRVALGLDPFHPSARRECSDGADEEMTDGRKAKEKGKAPLRSASDSHSYCGSYMDTGDDNAGQSTASSPSKRSDSQCTASRGWGQPNSIVVSGGCDKILRVWDINTGYCIYALPGHTSTIRCIKVLNGRPIAVTGARDATLRVWDVQKGKVLRVLEGHHQSVRCLDVCGNKVVSGSYDTTCRLWDVDTGACLHVLRGHYHQIYSVAYDGIRVASGGLDTTVRVWDAESGECVALLTGHTALVCQLQLSPTILATGGSDGRVITFSLTTFTPLHRIAAHDSSVTSLQFDKHFLITGGNDGRTRLFETETGQYIRELSGASESVWKVGFGGGRSGRDVCAIMCRREGETIIEIWSLRGEKGEEDSDKEGEEGRGKEDENGKLKTRRAKQTTV